MPKYEVVLERTTYYSLQVEAESAIDAIHKAHETPFEEFAENNTEAYWNEPDLIED
jgi:hypothetical protein